MDFNVKRHTLHTHQHMQRLSSYSCEATRRCWRQQRLRDLHGPTPKVSLPVGTRSKGALTTLLKPRFEETNFFLQWEYEVTWYELDNGLSLPDTVKIPNLLNETKGAVQQHLQVGAGQVTTHTEMRSIVVEYYRSTTTLNKLKMMHTPNKTYNGPQPMEIGMTWKGYR